MTDKYPAAPRLHEKLKLQAAAVGAAVAAGGWLLLSVSLVPLAIAARAGRLLLHGPRRPARLVRRPVH